MIFKQVMVGMNLLNLLFAIIAITALLLALFIYDDAKNICVVACESNCAGFHSYSPGECLCYGCFKVDVNGATGSFEFP